jgi:single-strand DNA-binding protein
MSFANAEVKGRVGQLNELRFTQAGTAVMNVSLAVNKKIGSDKQNQTEITEWYNIVLFGKNAERFAKVLQKGNLCWTKGELSVRKWKDKNGIDRTSTDVRAISFEICQTFAREDASGEDVGSFNREDIPF